MAVTAVVAASTAVGVAGRRLWRGVRTAVRTVDVIDETLRTVQETRRDVDELRTSLVEVEDVARLERGLLRDDVHAVQTSADDARLVASTNRTHLQQLRDALAGLTGALLHESRRQARTHLAYVDQLRAQGIDVQPHEDDQRQAGASPEDSPPGPVHRQREVDTE